MKRANLEKAGSPVTKISPAAKASREKTINPGMRAILATARITTDLEAEKMTTPARIQVTTTPAAAATNIPAEVRMITPAREAMILGMKAANPEAAAERVIKFNIFIFATPALESGGGCFFAMHRHCTDRKGDAYYTRTKNLRAPGVLSG